MKNKKEKGQYGYRDYHKKMQIVKVLFGGAMILVQLLARNFTDNQAAKNVLTLMAILSVLPTANVASPLLASWKYKTGSRQLMEQIAGLEGTGIVLYDLIVTSKEMIIPLDVVMVHPNVVAAFSPFQKIDKKKGGEVFERDLSGSQTGRQCENYFGRKAVCEAASGSETYERV